MSSGAGGSRNKTLALVFSEAGVLTVEGMVGQVVCSVEGMAGQVMCSVEGMAGQVMCSVRT